MLIKEVVLENFMSYEFSRIPLKPGLNVICGPNGSGKSSILLAISVALGQAYTERSRRLSDLIRRGKETARVTLVLDNTPRMGRRPIPSWRADTFQISRYLKADGTYWFEANFRPTIKNEVVEMLGAFGLNPDNLLLIMHQGMVEEFSVTSPQQKLRMLEEAVGFESHRRDILEAQKKLSQLLSEEQSLSRLLENAEQTLTYWREEYEKYMLRRELLQRKEFLERELLWAQVSKQERVLETYREKIERRRRRVERTDGEIAETGERVKKLQGKLHTLNFEEKKLYYALLELEKSLTEAEVTSSLLNEFQEHWRSYSMEAESASIRNPERRIKSGMESYLKELASRVQASGKRMEVLKEKAAKVHTSLDETEKEIDSTLERYLNERVKAAVLVFQKESLEDELKELNSQMTEGEQELAQILPVAEKSGLRVETQRSPTEVSEDVKVTEARIVTLGRVSEDVEKMYGTYSSLYTDLKGKIQVVSENKLKALEEIRTRMDVWRNAVRTLLDDLNPKYRGVLSKVEATGRVRVINDVDIEAAGLELSVGFRSAELMVLDAYTQSGGERSVAVMAFLLALQQHVKSPFRAVDEYDVHMDPRNREVIFSQLISALEGSLGTQYIVITPSQLAVTGKEAHVITVQNVHGVSEVKEAT